MEKIPRKMATRKWSPMAQGDRAKTARRRNYKGKRYNKKTKPPAGGLSIPVEKHKRGKAEREPKIPGKLIFVAQEKKKENKVLAR